MLTDAERADQKALIEAQIAELEEAIPRLQERTAPVSPDAAIGRLSRTDSMMNAGTVGLVLKESLARLTRLRNRLQKIDEPDFDQCAMCGGQLTMERLRAVPDRGICAVCFTKVSQGASSR